MICIAIISDQLHHLANLTKLLHYLIVQLPSIHVGMFYSLDICLLQTQTALQNFDWASIPFLLQKIQDAFNLLDVEAYGIDYEGPCRLMNVQ